MIVIARSFFLGLRKVVLEISNHPLRLGQEFEYRVQFRGRLKAPQRLLLNLGSNDVGEKCHYFRTLDSAKPEDLRNNEIELRGLARIPPDQPPSGKNEFGTHVEWSLEVVIERREGWYKGLAGRRLQVVP